MKGKENEKEDNGSGYYFGHALHGRPLSGSPPSRYRRSGKTYCGSTDDTLSQLYQMMPGAREAVAGLSRLWGFQRPGYKDFHLRIRVGQGGRHQQRHKKSDLYGHGRSSGGLGFGISKFRQVFIFQTPEALNNFINCGIELGAQMTEQPRMEVRVAPSPGRSTLPRGFFVPDDRNRPGRRAWCYRRQILQGQ